MPLVSLVGQLSDEPSVPHSITRLRAADAHRSLLAEEIDRGHWTSHPSLLAIFMRGHEGDVPIRRRGK